MSGPVVSTPAASAGSRTAGPEQEYRSRQPGRIRIGEIKTMHEEPYAPPSRTPVLALGLAVALTLLAGLAAGLAGDPPAEVQQVDLREFERGGLQPPLPPATTFPSQLVLDDNSAESAVGLFGKNSRQFLWFNRFAAAGVELQEIWVFFPAGEGVSAGDDVQLVVYDDDDGDPTNGATLVLSLDVTVQVADGIQFSVYPIAPLQIEGEALIGVVPRFIVSGVTPPVAPAALDTTASQGRSYFAFWLGDPPALPELPPDDEIVLADDLLAFGGNWTIRAFGTAITAPIVAIPAVSPTGLAVLALLIALTAPFVLARPRR
jgi:hypothetical protein